MVRLDDRRQQFGRGGAAGGENDRGTARRQSHAERHEAGRAFVEHDARCDLWPRREGDRERRRATARRDHRVGEPTANPLVDDRGAELGLYGHARWLA